MPSNKDRYDLAYADKLWNLLPAIYQAEDSNQFGVNGPLHEMVNRIGSQTAIVRRSIDRLWEDQAIETCDDWVIPYIAALVATNLVSSLDARGQRLDVAKTIYYRRRKGTAAILEEIAHDITGWDVKVVEFFRRLSRARHNFDPPIGLPSATDDFTGNTALQFAEGLVGRFTHTAIGGTADLRNTYGGTRAQTAFDEYYHTADLRAGKDMTGWQNIPNLGVFMWQLYSFGVGMTTPVTVSACPGQLTMDPTGRDIQLFAVSSRTYGDTWVSPLEWQIAAPIDTSLFENYLAQLYAAIDPVDGVSVLPDALGIFDAAHDLITVDQITADPREVGTGYFIDPKRGRIIPPTGGKSSAALTQYHYGFSSTIGAGPYDRSVLALPNISFSGATTTIIGGASALSAPLAAVAPTGTISINDSQTYTSVSNVNGIVQVMLQGANKQRPVIRLPAPGGASPPPTTVWTFTGLAGSSGAANAQLVLEGLLVTGGEIALAGTFDTVIVRCSTLDPGQWNATANTFDDAADARLLGSCRLRVLAGASVGQLLIDRSIMGPIITEGNGSIDHIIAIDSVIQGSGPNNAIDGSRSSLNLARTTVLGKITANRIDATECILDDVATVTDTQNGCIRFCAWAAGSKLPRRYESAEVLRQAPLFTSRRFGDAGYARLLETADQEIVPPSLASATSPSISEGAQNGSEMGAFSLEMNAIKERSLLIKYQEYMPLGLTPVLVRMPSD